jgi:hypothetical protein
VLRESVLPNLLSLSAPLIPRPLSSSFGDWIGTGSGRLGLSVKAGVGDRNPSVVEGAGETVKDFKRLGVGDRPGDSEMDMEELNDWSTSMGRSASVRVGDGNGEEKRVEGKDSMSGDEEKQKLILATASIV